MFPRLECVCDKALPLLGEPDFFLNRFHHERVGALVRSVDDLGESLL